MYVKATSLLGFNGAKRSGERPEDAAAVGRSDPIGMEVWGGCANVEQGLHEGSYMHVKSLHCSCRILSDRLPQIDVLKDF